MLFHDYCLNVHGGLPLFNPFLNITIIMLFRDYCLNVHRGLPLFNPFLLNTIQWYCNGLTWEYVCKSILWFVSFTFSTVYWRVS